jgi:hypothetical protein
MRRPSLCAAPLRRLSVRLCSIQSECTMPELVRTDPRLDLPVKRTIAAAGRPSWRAGRIGHGILFVRRTAARASLPTPVWKDLADALRFDVAARGCPPRRSS